MEQVIVVQEVAQKSGTSQQGKAWTRYAVKDSLTGDVFSTFDHNVGKAAQGLTGKPAKIEWEPKGDFKNLEGIGPHETPREEGDSRLSKEEWAEKDRRTIRTAIWKSFLEGGVASSVMNGGGLDGLLTAAKPFVERVEAHIYSEPQPEYGPAGPVDDIPFMPTSGPWGF